MHSASVKLLTNGGATSGQQYWPGGKGVFQVVATFGGGSVGLEYLGPDGVTWVAPAGGSLLANGGFVFELAPCQIRAAVSVGPTGVHASAERIPE